MKKVIIVTPFASKTSILKYSKIPLIGIENGIELISKCNLPVALGIGDFDTLDYQTALKYLKPNQIVRLDPHKYMTDTEAAVSYMQKLGFDEMIILCSLSKRYDQAHALLLLTKKYPKCKIYLEDDNNFITYYGKGNHVIQKQDYRYVGFFGFPTAVIGFDNSSYKNKKIKLDFTETKAISNELLDRVVEIDVYKGGVLVVQSKEKVND
ncbi:thiamine pyrophosphokinase [Firmicutes bacterium CAG:449]|nr:thiamine pyrophosphokinase [Firmicutes bacterium CAG:449]